MTVNEAVLDDRLRALVEDGSLEAMPASEVVAAMWKPFRTVASVKGTRNATYILVHDEKWVRVRVRHWLPAMSLSTAQNDGPWENSSVDSRIAALEASVASAEVSDFVAIVLSVCGWAHEQEDHSGKTGVVIMTMSDWGIHGSAKALLSQVAAVNPGVPVNTLRVLAGLQGHRYP